MFTDTAAVRHQVQDAQSGGDRSQQQPGFHELLHRQARLRPRRLLPLRQVLQDTVQARC